MDEDRARLDKLLRQIFRELYRIRNNPPSRAELVELRLQAALASLKSI